MKEKDSLFSTLAAAESGVSAAAAAVLRVNEARAAGHYNYTKTIETKHRHKICGVMASPTFSYHQETRFDQQRFDNDLANANKQLVEKQQQLAATKIAVQQKIDEAEQLEAARKLAEKEQQLEAAKIDLQQKIDAAHSIINQHDALQKNNQNLLSSINHQKNNLNAHGNLDHKTASISSQKNSLQASYNQARSEASNLPSRIAQTQSQLAAKKQEQLRLEAQRAQACQASSDSQKALYDKIAALDNCDRAKLVFQTVSDGNDELLAIVASCGYWKEFTAHIAVEKNSLKVLNYCINQGIDFDSFIDENLTLASSILKIGNNNFINALFASGQSLQLTALSALTSGDFAQLAVICNQDDQILSKIQAIDACGLSAIQLAIASGNLDAVNFIKEHEPECLSQEIHGYKNIFEMALVYNNVQIIEAIAECINQENIDTTISSFLENNQVDMFERVLTNVKFSQEQLCEFYKKALSQDYSSIGSLVIKHIEDVRALFSYVISEGNLNAAMGIICDREEEVNLDYINELMSHTDSSSGQYMLLSDLCEVSNFNAEEVELVGYHPEDQSQLGI